MKSCPLCTEEIQDKAIKCRRCGEFLDKSIEKSSSDHLKLETSSNSLDLNIAHSNKRFINFIIDILLGYVFVFICAFFLGFFFSDYIGGIDEDDSIFWTLISYIFLALYYLLFESVFGKTPAKWITKSKVVTLSGEKPNFLNILGRTLCRFIPFEAFSFLGKKAIGWHDILSNTRVVNDK